MLTLKNLEICFESAIKNKAKFIAVKMMTEGNARELISIYKNVTFEKRLGYYKNDFNEDLTLKESNKTKIVGFTFGNSFKDIEEDLFT